jgi:hypothetical protein
MYHSCILRKRNLFKILDETQVGISALKEIPFPGDE